MDLQEVGWGGAMDWLDLAQDRDRFIVNAAINLITALQRLVQRFGLPNQFLPSSSILDKGLPIWHF
jgi:hypothetical protein